MDPFKRVNPGDKIVLTADGWTAAMETARAFRLDGTVPDGPRNIGFQREVGNVCKVKNNTGTSLDRFYVLDIGDPIITATANLAEFKRQITFIGAAPGATAMPFVILLEPLGAGAIGDAQIAGVVPVQVSVTDASHEYCSPTNGVTSYLLSGATGLARILWKESGTGTKWALIRMDERGFGSGTVTFSGAKAYQLAGTNLANASYDAVTFDSEYYDTSSYHDTGSNTDRLTPPSTGYYSLGAFFNIAGNATGIREVKITDDGGGIWAEANCFSPHATEPWSVTLTTGPISHTSGYYRLSAYQNSGAPLAMGHCIFWIEALGA